MVRLLLARHDVDVNSKGNNGQTLLSWAAENGHYAVVRLLLARHDVDVNSKDNNRQTPLFYAVKNCHGAVVNLLFARVNPNAARLG
jgi:ankyrin repeat protein